MVNASVIAEVLSTITNVYNALLLLIKAQITMIVSLVILCLGASNVMIQLIVNNVLEIIK